MVDTSARSLVARWTAPLLLVAVAVFQIARVHTVDQSAWSGSGFGMFAVVDGEDSRWILAHFDPDDGEARRVAVPDDLRRMAFEARVVPSERRTRDLARQIADRLGEPGQLTVEVWGPELHQDPLRLAAQLLQRVGLEVTDGS